MIWDNEEHIPLYHMIPTLHLTKTWRIPDFWYHMSRIPWWLNHPGYYIIIIGQEDIIIYIYILYSMIHLILSCIMDYISRILYHEIHLISHISPEDFLIFRVRQLGGWKPGVEGLWRPFLHAPRAPCGKYRHEAVGHGRWIGYTWCIAWKIVVYPGYSTWCIMDSTNFGYKSMYSMETSHLWMLFSHLEVICSIDPVLYIDISLNFW